MSSRYRSPDKTTSHQSRPAKCGTFFYFPSSLMGIGAQEHRMKRRHHSVVTALSALTLGSTLMTACANTTTIKLSNSAKTKYEKRDYQGAVSDYNKVLALDPQDWRAFDNRGSAKFELGDYQGAIADVDKSLAINPQNTIALNNRGTFKVAVKDLQGALADYSKVIEIDPQDPYAYASRCPVKKALQDPQGAIADCSAAIEIDPQNAVTYNNLGAAKDALKDYKGAASDYSKAIEINPQYALAYSNLAVSNYHVTGDVKSSCENIKKSASLGYEYRINWLNSEEGKWCRDM